MITESERQRQVEKAEKAKALGISPLQFAIVNCGSKTSRRTRINVTEYHLRVAEYDQRLKGKGNDGVCLISTTSGSGVPQYFMRAMRGLEKATTIEEAQEIVNRCWRERFKRNREGC